MGSVGSAQTPKIVSIPYFSKNSRIDYRIRPAPGFRTGLENQNEGRISKLCVVREIPGDPEKPGYFAVVPPGVSGSRIPAAVKDVVSFRRRRRVNPGSKRDNGLHFFPLVVGEHDRPAALDNRNDTPWDRFQINVTDTEPEQDVRDPFCCPMRLETEFRVLVEVTPDPQELTLPEDKLLKNPVLPNQFHCSH
jgi:hypothetical protein